LTPDVPDPKAGKARLRAEISAAVRAVPAVARVEESRRVCECILASPWYPPAQALMIYIPLRLEVDVGPLATAALDAGKAVYVPEFDPQSRAMWPVRIDVWPSEKRLHGKMGGPDAEHGGEPAKAQLPMKTLIVVPGIAFDSSCNRLGRGMGFYDYFLKGVDRSCVFVGASFQCQCVSPSTLPVEEHDVTMHAVATPARLYTAARPYGTAASLRGG